MHRNWWIFVGVLILIALGSWWFAATRPFNSSTDPRDATTAALSSQTLHIQQIEAFSTTRQSADVQSIVASLQNASQFQALFKNSGLSSQIDVGGRYTIFVPTDAAFARLPKTTLAKMTAVQKKQLVAYHIVTGQAIAVGSELAGSVRALSGDSLNFTRINNVPMVDSAIILSAYTGSNGVVYVIDAVLIPPKS